MFHAILGEDAKYLSEGEEIGSQELFDTLNNIRSYTGEDEDGDSELMYLDMIRKLRDENSQLFEKIKRLPKKARSGRLVDTAEVNQLVTFFRTGKLKKFYSNKLEQPAEITFFEAARLLECLPDTPRQPMPEVYYHLLELNKQQFQLDQRLETDPINSLGGGRSNTSYIEHRLKDKAFKHCQKFTDSDEEFIDALSKMLSRGTIAKKVAQSVRKELEKTLDPLEVITILRKHIRVVDTPEIASETSTSSKREVILSGYQIAQQP